MGQKNQVNFNELPTKLQNTCSSDGVLCNVTVKLKAMKIPPDSPCKFHLNLPRKPEKYDQRSKILLIDFLNSLSKDELCSYVLKLLDSQSSKCVKTSVLEDECGFQKGLARESKQFIDGKIQSVLELTKQICDQLEAESKWVTQSPEQNKNMFSTKATQTINSNSATRFCERQQTCQVPQTVPCFRPFAFDNSNSTDINPENKDFNWTNAHRHNLDDPCHDKIMHMIDMLCDLRVGLNRMSQAKEELNQDKVLDLRNGPCPNNSFTNGPIIEEREQIATNPTTVNCSRSHYGYQIDDLVPPNINLNRNRRDLTN